jgi:hypothetical protein
MWDAHSVAVVLGNSKTPGVVTACRRWQSHTNTAKQQREDFLRKRVRRRSSAAGVPQSADQDADPHSCVRNLLQQQQQQQQQQQENGLVRAKRWPGAPLPITNVTTHVTAHTQPTARNVLTHEKAAH